MSMFIHFGAEDDTVDYEDLRDKYVDEVDNNPMASLNEIKNVHNDNDFLSPKDFCEKHNLY